MVELVRRDDLAGVSGLGSAFARAAKADSYWQMLMLAGALDGGWRGTFLSYEAPTYFGMLCAAYEPRHSGEPTTAPSLSRPTR